MENAAGESRENDGLPTGITGDGKLKLHAFEQRPPEN